MGYDGSLKFDTKVNTTGFSTGISKISTLAKTGLRLAGGLITGAATALTGMATASVATGQDFDAGMSKVQAISGATAEEMDALTSKAEEMGATTKFTASEAADALSYMAMAGWKTEDMLNGIDGVMDLAAASGVDLATTSDIVTDALTAFGLSAEDSGHFADVLASASSNANTNVDLMGETFKYVAPVAGALGMSTEDVAVAVGLMANSGIKGSQAGTALRATLTRLAKPTKQSATAMEALGISLTDNEGNVKSLDQLIVEMRGSFENLTDAEKAEYAAMIAGQNGMSGLLAIVNASDEDFNTLTTAINNCEGAAKDMATTMQDNLQGKLTVLKSSLEGLGIKIFNELESPMSSAVSKITEAINDISQAAEDDGLEGAVSKAGEVLAGLATDLAEKAPDMITAGVTFIQSFVDGLVEHKEELQEAGKKILTALFDGVTSFLPEDWQGPIKRIYDALSGSAEDGALKDLLDTLKTLIEGISSTAGKMLDGLATSLEDGGLQKLLDALVTVFKSLVSIFNKIIDTLGPGIVSALDLIGSQSEIVVPLITGVVTALLAMKATTAVITAVQGAIGLLNGAMAASPIGLFITAIVGAAGLIWALDQLAESMSDSAIAQKNLKEANENLGKSAEDFGDKYANALETIQNARGDYDEFVDSLFMTDEELQAHKNGLKDVQERITKILETESGKRNELTRTELAELQELYRLQDEHYNALLTKEQNKQKAIRASNEEQARSFQGTKDQFISQAAEWLKTAEDSKNEELRILKERYYVEFEQRRQEMEKRNDLSDEEKEAELRKITEKYEALKQETNDHYDSMVGVIQEKATEILGVNTQFINGLSFASSAVEKEQERHNGVIERLQTERAGLWVDFNNKTVEQQEDIWQRSREIDDEIEEEKIRHNEQMAIRYEDANAAFESANDSYVAEMMALATEIATNGGSITAEQSEMMNSMIGLWRTLPDDCDAKGKIEEMFTDAAKVMGDQYPEFKRAAEKGPAALVNAFETVANSKVVGHYGTVASEDAVNAVMNTLTKGSAPINKQARDMMSMAGHGIEAAGIPALAIKEAAKAAGWTEEEFKRRAPELQRICNQFAASGKQGFTDADLKGTFGSKTQEAVNAANWVLESNKWSMRQKGQEAGEYMGEGVGSGIESKSWSVSEKVKGLINNAVNTARSWAQINSPSKLFADKIGAWIPPGIAEGIDDAMPGLLKTTRKDMQKLSDEMTTAVDMEVGTLSLEKTGKIEFDRAMAERLAQTSVSVSGEITDERPVEIHTHLHMDKRQLAEEITPEIDRRLYKIDQMTNGRGRA